ncbi:ComF family protein [Rhodobacteraceae bacterium]|nr:ComF family protein [Paracoccaceae bacterium]
MQGLQRGLSLIYPAQCQMCRTLVSESGGLCGPCWAKTPFLRGLLCDACGTSLPGSDMGDVLCDDCMTTHRPWEAGRAALSYRDLGRRIVLSLKHGDRLDLAAPAASWMLSAGRSLLTDDTLFVPIPVHWTRLFTRRYNQAAELARAMSWQSGLRYCPDALVRTRRTVKQDGMTVDARHRNMDGAIATNPKRANRLKGATVCLVDDVMTSGATFTVATEALRDAGVDHVFVVMLARVEKTN